MQALTQIKSILTKAANDTGNVAYEILLLDVINEANRRRALLNETVLTETDKLLNNVPNIFAVHKNEDLLYPIQFNCLPYVLRLSEDRTKGFYCDLGEAGKYYLSCNTLMGDDKYRANLNMVDNNFEFTLPHQVQHALEKNGVRVLKDMEQL